MPRAPPPGSDQAPKVFGLSLKDRAAVLPAGHMANAAFWLDTTAGNFVTSTYYRKDLPSWAADFNAKKIADSYAGKAWTYLDPSAGAGHTLPPLGQALYGAVYGSPFGNDLLEAFAEAALQGEKLGQRGVTDILTVSFSSNDAVGHAYGPDSPEVHDIAVRTDRVIGQLLARVDCPRRPRPHHRRADGRPWRRPAAGASAEPSPAGRTLQGRRPVQSDPGRADGEVRRRASGSSRRPARRRI